VPYRRAGAGTTFSSLTRDENPFRPGSKALQELEVAHDEGFLLGARPALELALALEGREAGRVFFGVDQGDRPAVTCEGAGAAVPMLVEPASNVPRLADVQTVVSTAEDVDEVRHDDDDGIVVENDSRALRLAPSLVEGLAQGILPGPGPP